MKDFGDPLEWLTAIIRTDRPRLIQIARGEGLAAEDALECVQDALCGELIRANGEPITEAHARARLTVTVRNAARNARRLHSRAKEHIHWEASEHSSDRPTAETLVAEAEDVVRLNACVAELCEIQRSVVLLRLLEERSGQDVAEELGMKRNYVDVLLARARSSLKVCMSS